VGASALARAVAITAHLETAASAVQRSEAPQVVVFGKKSSYARLDSRGGCPNVVCGNSSTSEGARAHIYEGLCTDSATWINVGSTAPKAVSCGSPMEK
jgi:hypothetical protein